jgi:hypothetical protein
MAGRGNASLNRQNEYFVPRDGIDREVITADICRYLGNDALVRPGTYENKETGQLIQGYYINAYRNLTTAMIDDLKEASRQWQLERTRAQSGGGTPTFRDPNVVNVRNSNSPITAYRHSETHHRQQAAGAVDPGYGNPAPQQQYYAGSNQPQYSQPVANNYPPQGYPNAPQGNYGYQTSGNTYSPPPGQTSRYPPPQGMQSYAPTEQPYLAGSNLGAAAPQYTEVRREQPPRMAPGGPAAVYGTTAQQQSTYPAPAPVPGGVFYSQPQQGQAMYAPVQVQPQDPFYGRGGGAGQYDDSASPTTQTQSDRVAGQANQTYSPEPVFEDTPMSMAPPVAPAAAPARRDPRDHDERHRHHHQPGRR